ncbi:MAG TPA: hypothetical protein VF745_04925 [Steroidobacteraceae bacterium]
MLGPAPVEPSSIRPSAPAPLPVRASRASLTNIIGWPAATLLTAGYAVLIARLTSFPFEDLPDHLARAKVLGDLLFHHGRVWGGTFAFHFRLVPYLLHDLILTSLVASLGTAAGGAVFNELLLLSLPCALLYYMHVNRVAAQARPFVILISLFLATDWFFLVGFAAFRSGVAVLIACIALADALRERWSTRLYAVYLAAVLAGYLEHLTVPAFLAATLVVSGAVRLGYRRADLRAEMRLVLPVIGLLALYFGVLAGPRHPASPSIYSLEWGTVAGKLQGLRDEFFRYGGRSYGPMMLLLAFCLLWPVRRELASPRRLLAPEVLEQIALAVAFLGIYALLPKTYSGAAYVDVRALPMVVLFVLFAVLRLTPASSRGGEFASAPALAAAAVLAAVNLAYIGWHLEKNNAWMVRYRAVVAQIPRGALVLPIFTYPKVSILPLPHASAFVLLDRDGLIPDLFAGNLGDPMSYFDFVRHPYAPVEQWYRFQQVWNRSPVFTFHSQGQSYSWRFHYDHEEHHWRPAVLAPVSWGAVACRYRYILVTQPYDPAYIGVPTHPLTANSSAALLAVDRHACRPGGDAASGMTLPPAQVTY